MSSFRTRLALRIALGMLAILALASILAYRTGSQALTTMFDQVLKARLTLLQGVVEQEGPYLELEKGGKKAIERSWPAGEEICQVLGNPEHPTVYRSEALEENFEAEYAPDGALLTWDAPLPDGQPGRYASLQVPCLNVEPLKSVGFVADPVTLRLLVAHPRESLNAAMFGLAQRILGVSLTLLVGAILLTLFVVRRGLAPLDAFGRKVEGLDVATLATPLGSDDHPRELRPVVSGLDNLLARVDDAFRREKRLAATIAHEFRTPFSEVRALTEVALEDPSDVEFTTSALRQVHEISIRMVALLDVIRALTDLDREHAALPAEPVDVEEILLHALAPLEDAIRDKGLSVRHEGFRSLRVRVNRAALTSICNNLLVNAVEYSTAGGLVECQDEADEDHVILRFSNPCVGLTTEHLDRLTEPFWRATEARAQEGHHGLGLNIAKGMASLAGMDLRFRLVDDTFTAEVQIPVSA